jgi:hypothetical protein
MQKIINDFKALGMAHFLLLEAHSCS